MKKIALAAVLAVSGGFVASAVSAPAGAAVLTCYRVGVERTPSASVKTNPPQANVDDGDPYIRYTGGGC